MILIIDGYNLLFNSHWPAQGITLEEKREHLIKEIANYRYYNHIKRVILVFDGQTDNFFDTSKTIFQGVEIYYAVCAGKADEKILLLCEELNDVEVVTADRGLARAVKSLRCKIVSPEDFIKCWYESNVKRKSSDSGQPCSPKAPTEVNQWLKLFGLKDEIEISDKNFPDELKLKKRKNTKW